MSSGPPISDVTSDIVMPIASLENLLPAAAVPFTSPSNLPSRDLTTRTGPYGDGGGVVVEVEAAVEGVAVVALLGWAEPGVVVPGAGCCVAQAARRSVGRAWRMESIVKV